MTNIIHNNKRYRQCGDGEHMEPMAEGPTIPIPFGDESLVIDPTDSQWFAAGIAEVLNDPATRDWVKKTYAECVGRDVVDAMADASLLYRLLSERFEQIKAERSTIWDSDGTDGPVLVCAPPANPTREQIRDLARKHNVKRGRNTKDTIANLKAAGLLDEKPILRALIDGSESLG